VTKPGTVGNNRPLQAHVLWSRLLKRDTAPLNAEPVGWSRFFAPMGSDRHRLMQLTGLGGLRD